VDTGGQHEPAERSAAVVARIEGLCERGVLAAGVDGAGVSVTVKRSSPQPVLSTDERSARIEELQFTLGEGPCFEATATRSPVLVSDLSDVGEASGARWPAFLDEALMVGARAIFAFPLGVGTTAVGTLDLYRTTPGPLSAQQLSASLATADSLGIALLSEDPLGVGFEQSGWLRMTVHQAAGMVMVQMGGTIEDALLTLRASAYGEGRSVNDLAADVLAGRRRYQKEDER
jgi:hypothetical protein